MRFSLLNRTICLWLCVIGHLICFSSQTLAENISPISIDEKTADLHINDGIRFLADSEHSLTADEIFQANENSWLPLPNHTGNFGFSEHAYWFKFSLQNTSEALANFYVHIDYALLDKIDFYQVANGKLIQHIQTGDHNAFHKRPIDYPTFLFPFSASPNEISDIYIRIDTQGTVKVPVTIWEKDNFLLASQSFLFLYGCFLSAMLIMSAYNLCLFFTIRDKSYLVYSLFILLATGVHSSLDGFAYQWFWPESPFWHQISAIFFIATGCFVTTLFTRMLLPIPKRSKTEIGITFLMILTGCSALMSLLISYRHAAMLNAATTVISMSGIVLICLAMLRHSPSIARYFILAWSTYFVGIILKSTSNVGLIDSNFLSEYAGNIGAVSAILIMSLALSERIKQERLAREQAQSDSITHLKRYESLYENALEGVFTFNNQGQLLSANPAFYRLTGIKDLNEFNSRAPDRDKFSLTPDRFERLLVALKKEGRVNNHETQISSLSGVINWISVSARLTRDSNNNDIIEGTLINISDRKEAEERLRHLANHDPLTGLVNRRVFEQAITESLAAVKKQHTASLLYLDLDQFKIVNDLCGHSAGDVLLRNLSQRLHRKLEEIQKQFVIARLGGDEFGILLNNTALHIAKSIAEQIRESIEEFLFVWEGHRFVLGVSIGLVELLPFHQSVEQVVVMADTACYLAKDQGRNRVHIFVESDQELEFRQIEMQWVNEIKQALNDDSFFLVFQEISANQSIEDGFHYEILLRLVNKQGNLTAPGQFLPPAERYNLMPNIDRWVINHYFSWLRDHPSHLEQLSCASINLSPKSIGDDNFSNFLMQAFEDFSIPFNKICFEITESMAITHIDNTHEFIETFHNLGCRFALDDFGTGFSSYAYLKELKVDYLKIDGVFIKNLTEDAVSLAMVKSISDVASAIGIETIAEFVETEEIKSALTEIGINYSQGYHIHKPMKLDISRFNEQTVSI